MLQLRSGVVVVRPGVVQMAQEVTAELGALVVPGWRRTSHLRDEQLLQTVDPHTSLRINFYERPRKVLQLLYQETFFVGKLSTP